MTVIVNMNMNNRIYDTCNISAGAVKPPSRRLLRHRRLPLMRWLPFPFLLLLPLPFLLLLSCGDDYGTDAQENPEIRFRLKLPADAPDAATYAMNNDDERQLNTATVMAFVKSGNDYYFRYIRTASISQSGQDADITIWPEKGDDQRFLILANCNEELASPESTVITSDNIAAVLDKLTVRQTREWPVGEASDGNGDDRPLKHIPLAALTGNLDIGDGITTVGSEDNPVNLIRMLARIDVSLKENITNFKLVSACIFNRKDRGHIAYNPDPAYWDETDSNAPKAKKAWVPASAQTAANPTSFDYYKAGYGVDARGAIKNRIYTFESAATGRQNATAIVVGGYYNHPVNSTKITYYRLEIPQTSNGDILRNHLYGITIENVTGEGTAIAEDAFKGLVTLQAGITIWNLAECDTDLAEPGEQEDLTIDRGSLRYYKTDVATKTVKVTSTQNWTASVVSSDNWITNVTASGNAGTDQTLSFSLQTNNTGSDRTGYITVKAGNLTTKVKITQLKDGALAFSKGASGGAGIYGPGITVLAKSFTVTARSPWTAEKTDDPDTVIEKLYNAASIKTIFPSDETFRFAMTGVTSDAPALIRFSSPAGAFDPVTVSITSQNGIVDWNLANTDDTDLAGQGGQGGQGGQTGQADLSIDRVALFYCKQAVSTQTLKVTSTKNWMANVASPDNWITNVTASGSAGADRPLSFSLQTNNTGSDRIGYITVKAGNLTAKVKITQSKDAALAFSDGVNGTAGIYNPGSVSVAKSFTVTAMKPWRAEKTSDPGNIIGLLYNAANTGTTFPLNEMFRFAMTGVTSETPALIRFSSPTGEFDPVTVSITSRDGIVDWNLANTGDTNLPGQESQAGNDNLSINRGSLFYYKTDVLPKTVKVTSTKNWTANVAAPDNWITIVTPSGSAGTDQTLSFSLQTNNTGSDRTGYITVKAGNLTAKVKITQSKDAALTFSDGVSGTAGVYNAAIPGVKSFTVTAMAPWRAVKTSDPGIIGLLYNVANTGTTFPLNEAFRFAMTGVTSATPALITFSSPTGAFDPVTVSITTQ